ncbi:peptidoglycan DD-metalloendopeptidase family protein [Rhizobium sp. CRIBSB]|nr:peptidoglycan DD-metalloendopeptidase family protein [Rhizobium sp. CRIBSB]
MRKSVSPKAGLPVARLCGVLLLAGTAAGCSSDASRFSSIFSTDNLTTASIPRQSALRNQPPIPAENIGGGAIYGQQQAMAQPMPASPSYQLPVSARAASTPAPVQRAELAAPSGIASPSNNNSERAAALAQPFPAAPQQGGEVAAANSGQVLAEPRTTGTTPKQGGWSTAGAARVTLRPGETIATLADRYGVPQKEILKANGLTQVSDAAPGQLVIIPTFGGPNPARAAADASGLPTDGRKPVLPGDQQQNVAVLPTAPNSREKQQVAASAATGKTTNGAGTGAGSYVVKPGDSLARIAKTNGVSVDDLKAANSLTTGNIRIGQALVIPAKSSAAPSAATAQAAPAADPVKTASVPAAGQPAEYKAPAATKSVTDVAAVKPETAAPEMTGIDKYRWPVRGAVIANFGANIDGKRSDGIAISVPPGTPIKAAENGVVIYAGNGLKELGNTVLVRHDDGKVTVYGHADSLSVQRGQKVQRGQTIATSGMTGNVKRPMLHFEVRKDAAPVNPITYLE